MKRWLRWTWSKRGIWIRALLCLGIGISFSIFEETSNYDVRFQLRGEQPHSSKIVLVNFEQEDWNDWHGQNRNLLRSLKEFSVITDSFYWNPKTWKKLLAGILKQNPASVGVTFFFNPQLAPPREPKANSPLYDPRVIWAAELDSEGRPVLPAFSTSYGYNTALIDMRADDDQILRRFSSPLTPLPHMGLKLAESQIGSSLQDLNSLLGETKLINFRGPPGIFPTISARDVLQGRVPPHFFTNKIIIVGSQTAEGHRYQTPVGTMSRSQVMAHIVDNVINHRWFQRLSPQETCMYLLLILLIAVLILTTYPQTIAFVFLFWCATLVTALSLWVFDTFNFWMPISSPLIELATAYVVFVGYQLTLKENQAWKLVQEKRFITELEQLKNNFVSLISHDLKTPIAKIQAICDRLLASSPTDEVGDGLKALRKESVELHRYIQSILQISRLESSQIQLRSEATDLNELVENVCEQLGPLWRDKNQILTTSLEPMFSIEIDGVLIQEVILNLIENAIKYTPAGGRIQVKTEEVDDKAVFSVQDSGPGISSEEQDRIFEKFFRGEAHQTQTKGTGLGLFLVKYFVELHGGEVFLESELGKGTRVGFTLPLAPAQEDET